MGMCPLDHSENAEEKSVRGSQKRRIKVSAQCPGAVHRETAHTLIVQQAKNRERDKRRQDKNQPGKRD